MAEPGIISFLFDLRYKDRKTIMPSNVAKNRFKEIGLSPIGEFSDERDAYPSAYFTRGLFIGITEQSIAVVFGESKIEINRGLESLFRDTGVYFY